MQSKFRPHAEYIGKYIAKKSPEEMASELGIETEAIKRLIHRYRIVPEHKKRNNLAYRIIQSKFIYPEYFSPTQKFFKSVNIGQKRWSQLFKGDAQMTNKEFESVVLHLKLDKKELSKTLSLELFENDI